MAGSLRRDGRHAAEADVPLAGDVELSRRRVADAVTIAGMDAEGRYVTRSGEHPRLRGIVLDVITECARHLGHADLLRESADGLVGEDPDA